MLRRTLILLAVASLLFTVAPTASAAGPYDIGGYCSTSDETNEHAIVLKQSTESNNFEYVSGKALVRNLVHCIGYGIWGRRGTDVLPANMENIGGRNIYQLGYSDSWSHGLRFIYACESPTAIQAPISQNPVEGRKYKFEIWVGRSGSVKYRITDITASPDVSWTFWACSAPPLSQQPDLAWWGYERQDVKSGFGNQHDSSSNVKIHEMQYRRYADTAIWERNGLNSNPWSASSNPNGILRTGNSPSCLHAHIMTVGDVNNDTIDGDSDC